MNLQQQIQQATEIVINGGVIAYPTEGVYGLGCSPFNEIAVQKILQLKQRSISKGLIIVSDSFSAVKDLTLPLAKESYEKIMATWPGPITWVFPASEHAPAWITGSHKGIALRISQYPLIKQLCEKTGPLVSTSANIATQPAAMSAQEVNDIFADAIDYIIDAPIGNLTKPTPIFDAMSGKQLR